MNTEQHSCFPGAAMIPNSEEKLGAKADVPKRVSASFGDILIGRREMHKIAEIGPATDKTSLSKTCLLIF